MAAAIIPAIQLGVSAFGAWRQRKAQKKQQEQALASQQAITDQAGTFQEKDRQITQLGLPLLQSTSNYYRALIGGDRGAIDSALAPERAGITDTYRGATRGLSMLRGPTRDLATAELNRQRAGQLGLLPAMARANAVEGGQRAGQFAVGTGLEAASRGASLYESAAGVGQNQARIDLANRQQNYDMSKGMGSLFGEVLKGIFSRGSGGGGSAPIPTTSWQPPMSPYPSSIYGRM